MHCSKSLLHLGGNYFANIFLAHLPCVSNSFTLGRKKCGHYPPVASTDDDDDDDDDDEDGERNGEDKVSSQTWQCD